MSELTRQAARHEARVPPELPNWLWNWGAFLDYRKDTLGFYREMARRGDVVYVQFGAYPIYFINRPDLVQYLLQQNHRNFKRSDIDSNLLSLLVGEGLLALSGDKWLPRRRLMQPAFHRHRIAAFGDTMVSATAQMLAGWSRVARRGRSLDIAREMMRLTLRVAGLTLFSVDLDEEAQSFGGAVTVGNRFLNQRLSAILPLPLWLPTPAHRAFKKARRALDEVVYGMLRERRVDPGGYDDLLAMLLEARDEETGEGLSDRELRDEIVTLLVAGHETTASALTWLFVLLSEHPEVERTLHAEVDRVLEGRVPTVEVLPKLTYTRMVIEEAMRLYPPAWVLSRQAIEEDTIDGYTVPAGSVILVSPYTMHRHPAYWEEPERFDPERFTPERSEGRHRFAYFPFGGGPRLCIGNQFAMAEMQLVLATIAQRYRLRLFPGFPVEVEPLITLRPAGAIRMSLYER